MKLIYKIIPALVILVVLIFSNIMTAETRTNYSEEDFSLKTFMSEQELENFILLKIKDPGFGCLLMVTSP
jgi:hypothetical protein